ncbi:MAG: TldD/PmbA family protein [Candidatus Thorarchaeota archaeon]|nr:TldD/PmbA family protein [Candidatus Thorarchaeota archaeon]
MKETLFEIGEKLLSRSYQNNIDQAEIYLESVERKNLRVVNGSVGTAKQIVNQGVGIRTAIKKQLGFSYATTLSLEDCIDILEKSATLARVSDETPTFVEFPGKSSSYPHVSGLYDRAIAELTSEELSELLYRAIEENQSCFANQETIIYGSLETATKTIAILNTNGILAHNETTRIMLSIDSTLRKFGEQLDSSETQYGTRLTDIDPEWIGRKAAENTFRMAGPKPVENKQMPIILSPLTLRSVFRDGLTPAINAENYAVGQSYLNGLLGSQIASEQLVIVDDGTLEGGYNSSPFDGEGTPSRRTEVLTGGVLKNLLHSSYTASASDSTSTGNAVRESYSTPPAVGCTNLRVQPRRGTLDDLFSEIDEGIYCHFALDYPDQLTGDISALILEGFLVIDGEIQHPLKNTFFVVNMCDLLKRVVSIGNDTRMLEGIVSPSILIDSVDIVSE